MLTRTERHNEIYDQLVYELFCDPLPKYTKNKPVKSTKGLCKRERFLVKSRQQKKDDPSKL